MTPVTSTGPKFSPTASNLVRALLDSIAISLGVAAVVVAVSVNHGAFQLSKGPTYGLDRRVVVVEGVAPSASGIEAGLPSSSLTPSDVTALGNSGYVPGALAVAPTVGVHTTITSLGRSAATDVIGSTDQFAKVSGYEVTDGRFITPQDLAADTPVVVLGQTIVSNIFAGANPIGQDVVIANATFEVVGVFQPRGYSGTYNLDNIAVMPITTAWKVLTPLQASPIDQVLIRAATPKSAVAVANEATTTLLQQHGIVDPALADFTVIRQSQLVTVKLQTAQAVRRLLELAGALLLLSGAVYLALSRVGVEPFWSRRSGGLDRVVAVLLVGVVGAVVGDAIGIGLTPLVHHLSSQLPAAKLTIYAVLAGAGAAVFAAAASLLPAAVRPLVEWFGGRRSLGAPAQ